MAQRTVVTFVSDLSGKPIEGNGATIRFGLDGTSYEVDLTSKEQQALREALAPYVEVARKVGATQGRRRSGSSAASEPTPKEIRAWAVENGYEVPARGRIPALVTEAYSATR